MTGALGKQYLVNYSNKVSPIFTIFFKEQLKQAHTIGSIPKTVVEKFLSIARGGKRLRGALFCLGYEVAGGHVTDKTLRASLAVELFHAGGLVQDDIVDRDVLRRGVPALHIQLQDLTGQNDLKAHFGESLAIFFGDVAMFYAFQLLLQSKESAERIVTAMQSFTTYAIHTGFGQILDIANATNQNENEHDVLSVLRYKSAEYSGIMPLIVGANLAGCSDVSKLTALRRFGFLLGSTFQIQDDILGMFGESKKTGKPVGNDLREGKYTLLMLHLAQHGSEKHKILLRKLLGNPHITQDDVASIQSALYESGSYNYLISLCEQYVHKGLQEIPNITKQKHLQEVLSSMLIYMMERVK